MKNIILLSAIILIFGCNKKMIDASKNNITIENIKTNEQKRNYLLAILADEQSEPKESVSDIILKYGKPSKEYDNYIKNFYAKNNKNIVLIEKYFSAFGYPKISEVGDDAASTPWLVFLQSYNFYSKERNFIYLYRGFQAGDMRKKDFMWLLDIMYNHKFGKEYQMVGEYDENKKIEQQITDLGLDKQIVDFKKL